MGGGELMFQRRSQILAGGGLLNEGADPLLYGDFDADAGVFLPSAPKYLKASFLVSALTTLNHVSVGFRNAEEPAQHDNLAVPYETFAVIELLNNGVVGVGTNWLGAGPVSAPVNDVSWAAETEVELMATLGHPPLPNVPGEWRFRAFFNGTEVFATNLPFSFTDPVEGLPPEFPLVGFIQVGSVEPVVQSRMIEFGDIGDLNDPH